MTIAPNESLLLLLGLLSAGLGVVLYLWLAVALAGLFRKTGEEPWQGWVPFLNIAVVLRLGGFSPWLVLLALIPGLGIVAVHVLVIVAAHRIGRDFGAGAGMTVLAALLFVVWASILGLGPAAWKGRRPEVEPPPWVFSPPMSEFTPLLAHRHAEPGEDTPLTLDDIARDQVAREQDAAQPWSPAEPVAPVDPALSEPAPEPAPDPVPSAPDASPRAPFQPSPWAPPEPPSPFAPAVTAPFAPEVAAPLGPSSEDPEPAAPSPVAGASPVAAEPAPPASRDGADEDGADDDGASDDRWPSEIDDVSAISPSPFPPSAASARPGVVPSLADSDDAGPHAPARRTWDAVPAAVSARRVFAADPDDFPELSEEVSAVIGAPSAGAPRTALGAVPAQQRRAEEDDRPDDVDHTVVVARRRAAWQLVMPEGAPVPLVGDVVILGRQPAADAAFPRAQLVGVEDRTRTVSKTHARLELRSDVWHITDLHSTNGVLLTSFLGSEIELEPGSDAPAGERFLLGDAELRLERLPT